LNRLPSSESLASEMFNLHEAARLLEGLNYAEIHGTRSGLHRSNKRLV